MENPLLEGLRDWADGTKRLQDENERLRALLERCYGLTNDAPRGRLKEEIAQALKRA